MSRTARGGDALAKLLPGVLIALCFVHGAVLGWRKWGDPIVDTGRELELPRRLLGGEVLYRDLRFYYGPLAPWINAALYRMFGVHADVLIAAGLTSAALMCWVVWSLARCFVGRVAATVLAIAFLYLCAFAHLAYNPTFNWVMPYTYAATYGMLAAAASLLFLVRHVRTRRTTDLALSVALLALASLAKMEVLVPAAAAHATFLIGGLHARALGRRHLVAYAAGALAVAGVYGGLALRAGARLWTDNLGLLLNAGSGTYIGDVMGLGELDEALWQIVESALGLAAVVAVGWALATVASRARIPAVARIALVAAAVLAPFFAYRAVDQMVPFRCLPLLVAALVVLGVARWFRAGADRPAVLADLLLWVFAAGCLLRIPLRAAPYHYGFFLLPVPMVALGVVLFRSVPARWEPASWPRATSMAAGVGFFAGTIALCLELSMAAYALHTVPLETPRGRLMLLEGAAEPAVLDVLATLPRDTRLLAVPQGAGLIFFSGLTPADGLFSYLPMEIAGSFDDAGLLASWQRKPPDAVVFIVQDMSEFGYQGFGVDYATRALEWLDANYGIAAQPAEGVFVLVREKTS